MISMPDWLGSRVKVIAEAGVNHNGSPEMALALIDAAVDAGADVIKFQTFRADQLVTRNAATAAYQKRSTGELSQWQMLHSLELEPEVLRELLARARTRGIEFLSSPFDLDSIDFLAQALDLPVLKIGSGEITNAPLLLHAARTQRPVILSTGMSTLEDIRKALAVLAFGYADNKTPPSSAAFEAGWRHGVGLLREKVALMHCTTEYPAPLDEVNLRAMQTMKAEFGLPVGYSDHTQGIAIAGAAVALGACVVEKHFTLDTDLPGPDHSASLMPDQFAAMVRTVREIERAGGSFDKSPTASELPNMLVARRSLVALGSIRKGDLFSVDNLGVRRPGTGLAPEKIWDFLGHPAPRDYSVGDLIE